ncbi:chitinase [Salinibacter sp. 10B]|uniref:glycoside hydrolase family 18 protein n=1 Tax=Salinibacter sp. 10B TaxID=1923971 RepID=UPI000CF54ADB|nr:glycoside hydrolase family 18 protein [Salinibacter sp. 10B]PQJ35483.1 chitinase [Salinibacter sp. 10B]
MPPASTGIVRCCAFIFSVGFLFACGGTSDAPDSTDAYVRLGYVHDTVAVTPEEARQLTHINYAFANVTEEGRVVLESEQDSANLAQLRALKSVHSDLKILLSIGGWAWSDYFSNAALTDSSRVRFARSAVALLRKHQLDGLDLDWEYPGQQGENNVYRPEDDSNFTRLLQTVRRHLNRQGRRDGRTGDDRYLLTIAAGASADYLAHTNMAAAHKPLDYVHLMTYDFHGSWTSHTGHHANLYPPATPDTMQLSAAHTVTQFIKAGVPARKLVLGVPFYGRGWAGVTPTNKGLYQSYEASRGGYPYDTLASLAKQEAFVRRWDSTAQAPTLWNADSSLLITYETPASLRAKTHFVKSRGLAGIMYWEHNSDDGTLLQTLYDHLH